MGRLALLLALLVGGWATGTVSGDVSGSSAYLFLTMLLLAVGLYGSTADIEPREVRQDVRLLALAVTFGVVAKAALIAGALWFVLADRSYVILAVAVAQIDPLSVAALRGSSRMSPRAKNILSVWASFDDPVTVLLTAYTVPLLAHGKGLGGSVTGYAAQLGWNAMLVAGAWVLWQLVRRLRGRLQEVAGVVLTAGVLVTGAAFTLMLGVAVAGLFLRPAVLRRLLGRVTQGAYAVAAFLLGMLLVGGVDFGYGLVLGASAYVAHALVSAVLTRRLDRPDRLLLALGQQNGVTAIVLALSLQPVFPKAPAIVAPAIVVVNFLHFGANWLLDRVVGPLGEPEPAPGPTLPPPLAGAGSGAARPPAAETTEGTGPTAL